jgi:hypothetical protein
MAVPKPYLVQGRAAGHRINSRFADLESARRAMHAFAAKHPEWRRGDGVSIMELNQ